MFTQSQAQYHREKLQQSDLEDCISSSSFDRSIVRSVVGVQSDGLVWQALTIEKFRPAATYR